MRVTFMLMSGIRLTPSLLSPPRGRINVGGDDLNAFLNDSSRVLETRVSWNPSTWEDVHEMQLRWNWYRESVYLVLCSMRSQLSFEMTHQSKRRLNLLGYWGAGQVTNFNSCQRGACNVAPISMIGFDSLWIFYRMSIDVWNLNYSESILDFNH